MNVNLESVIIFLICTTVIAASNWEIEIHFHQYNNPTGEYINGNCCDDDCVCEPEFRVCLLPGDFVLNGTCPYADFSAMTSTYVSANFIEFDDMINDIDNPIIFSAGGDLENVPATGLSLFIRVRDDPQNQLIDRLYESIPNIGTSANSTMLTGMFGKVYLILSYELRCQQNYYSTNCSVYCVPSDNATGHYTCDLSTGDKICLPEYQNPETDCVEVNINDCSPQPCQNGGICSDLINDYYCTCPMEYTGHNCTVLRNGCILSPCQHNGTCVNLITDYQCICSKGYSGEQCEVSDTNASVQASPTQNSQQGADAIITSVIAGTVTAMLAIITAVVVLVIAAGTVLYTRKKNRKVSLVSHNSNQHESLCDAAMTPNLAYNAHICSDGQQQLQQSDSHYEEVTPQSACNVLYFQSDLPAHQDSVTDAQITSNPAYGVVWQKEHSPAGTEMMPRP